MARGNQRDKAREKAQQKQADATKGQRKDGLSGEKRKEHDAEIMRQKQEKAAQKASAAGK
ncbi:putative SERF-like protein [Cladochytrium replicatum]|nr:putative SERF-like protein [Cladochytrium replicatum]